MNPAAAGVPVRPLCCEKSSRESLGLHKINRGTSTILVKTHGGIDCNTGANYIQMITVIHYL